MAHLHRFYVPPDAITGSGATLPGQEAHHALHVVRVKRGDTVALFDGQGRECLAEVEEVSRRDVRLRILEERTSPGPCKRVTLVQAWLNRDKPAEEVVRRAAELGVASVLFFKGQHSERAPRINDKLERAAVEACKQCGRLWLPEIAAAHDLEAVFYQLEGRVLIATQDAEPVPLRDAVTGGDVAVVVGPEGDFAPEEVAFSLEHGALPITLGGQVFRSEVAAALAAALVLYELGALAR